MPFTHPKMAPAVLQRAGTVPARCLDHVARSMDIGTSIHSFSPNHIRRALLNHEQRQNQCVLWIRLPVQLRLVQLGSDCGAGSKSGRHMWGEQQLHLCRIQLRQVLLAAWVLRFYR
jgi:hypothetical protein